jgi:hypothetical protein
MVLVLARLALLECLLCLVAGKGASESSEEAVVCLASKHATTNATCDGSHEATVAFLTVGVVGVTVRILAVLVTLRASG